MSSKSRVWVKPIDQMDVWLDSEGFYRKHTARDGTCLFRAVSEQLFLTQTFHFELRRQIVDYMVRHEDHFQKLITCPLMEYAEKMYNPREWGGKVEIEAMSLMYRKDFIMFQEIEMPPENVTNYDFKDKIMLCYSQDRHYDSVYTKDYITTAAFCQSTVYEMLYKNVFELKEVDYAVNKMLHDKTSRDQREQIPFLSTGFTLRLEMRDSYLNVKDLLDFGITPFPYKVAKSLDMEIYRNVEYDTWNEYRKGLRYGFCPWNCQELQVGAKCLVKVDDRTYHGHVQEMQPNKGPVIVFIEELGEMRSAPFDSLELLPPTSPSSSTPTKPSLPMKLHPLQLVDLKPGKKVMKNLVGRLKTAREIECYTQRQEKQLRNTREVKSPQTPVVSSSDFCKQEIDFHNEDEDYSPTNYQTITESEEQVCPDSTKPDHHVPVMTPIDTYRYPVYSTPLSLPIAEPATTYQQPLTVNLMAPKSMNVDGSDLPHSDMATLRFFYNLGLDHLRMNYVVRPGPTYYVNPGVMQPSYITIDSPTVPTYEHFPPAPIPEPKGREVTASPGLVSTTTDDSSQSVPPRFKNKMKPSLITCPKKSNTYEGSPLIQQCEVSSTNNYTPQLQPQPQPQPQPPPTPVNQTFFQVPECDQYCVTVPYVDYNCYDYPIYPSSPHGIIPSSYITPEGVIYQTMIPPAVIPAAPPM
ncbi:unnamed protein product [Nezara viridula]|uniref:OTU domain-containing protein n=1 Tax=Nezara viridula TaxID=85310 RepID=A0A9P0HM11_NEZVI|nr:unnamed protein product [Nezara viridula]